MTAIRNVGLAISLLVPLVVSACASVENIGPELALGIPPPSDERPQDEPVALGKLHYAAGDYGLSERYFRAAVEANPNSSQAWLGLAASYDRLRRFDLAERAYERLLKLEGRSAVVLNNLGYHEMLKGNLKGAHALLLEAARMDPENGNVRANLLLLDTWQRGEPGLG
jgi:Flp pilus assembly protein TadD